MKKILLLLPLVVILHAQLYAQTINTFAGTISSGYSGDGSQATAAQLYHPKAVVRDDTGNVYIADADNNVIRKVDPAGVITTYAGLPAGGFSGDGSLAIYALFSHPNSIALDRRGNMYICDADNQRIRKVNRTGIISTVAGDGTASYLGDGGAATAAEINYPGSIALDDTGNLYIADEYNNRIRKVDTFGIITTFAGNGSTGYSGEGGSATAASIGFPFGLAADHNGNIYFSLTLGNRICKVSAAHIITTAAGTGGGGGFSGDGGPATAADFDTPWGLSTDPSGNLYITDNANQRIRKVTMSTGYVSTVAGNGSSGFSGDGGAATLAKLQDPAGVYVDNGGALYIADYNNHRVRKVSSPYTHPPAFVNGHSQLDTVCESLTTNMDTLLNISDADAGQYETWSPVLAPAHGTLVSVYGSVSTGGTVMPSGLSYTPTIGYAGLDSFRVRIYDGTSADSTTVHLAVVACTTGLPSLSGSSEPLISPNPGTGDFSLLLGSNVDEPAQVVITDIAGAQVAAYTVLTGQPKELHLDVPPGFYLLHARSGHGSWTGKIVIR